MASPPKVPKPFMHLEVHYRVIISLVAAAAVFFGRL